MMSSYPRTRTAVRASKVALFIAWAAFAAVAYNIYSEVQELALIDHLEAIEDAGDVYEYDAETIAMMDANEERQDTAMYGYLGAVLLGTLFLLVWINRTSHACRELGATHMRFSPGWAVAYWFVPILNLVRPFQVVRELWQTTDIEGRSSKLIGWWWAAWLLSGGIGRYGSNIRLAADATLQDYRHADHVLLVSHTFDLIAFALTIALITKLTARLVAFRERVAAPQVRVVAETRPPQP